MCLWVHFQRKMLASNWTVPFYRVGGGRPRYEEPRGNEALPPEQVYLPLLLPSSMGDHTPASSGFQCVSNTRESPRSSRNIRMLPDSSIIPCKAYEGRSSETLHPSSRCVHTWKRTLRPSLQDKLTKSHGCTTGWLTTPVFKSHPQTVSVATMRSLTGRVGSWTLGWGCEEELWSAGEHWISRFWLVSFSFLPLVAFAAPSSMIYPSLPLTEGKQSRLVFGTDSYIPQRDAKLGEAALSQCPPI